MLSQVIGTITIVSLSTLNIQMTGNRKDINHYKIYLRCLYLFKDFLPYNYNFKYMDLYRIGGEQFPPLTLAINFAEFALNLETVFL